MWLLGLLCVERCSALIIAEKVRWRSDVRVSRASNAVVQRVRAFVVRPEERAECITLAAPDAAERVAAKESRDKAKTILSAGIYQQLR